MDDGRSHFSSGPIDLVIGMTGPSGNVSKALETGWCRFTEILKELVAELDELRSHSKGKRVFSGPIASRMERAVHPYARDTYVTPMAAVAGAVADDMLQTLRSSEDLRKIYVNNGGDIAFHLNGNETMTIGMVPDLAVKAGGPQLQGTAVIAARDGIGGVATSGWQGRSHSLGIADAVTVLAASAAQADVAATLIANAVNIESPKIERFPARELDPDSDLGNLPVTVAVDALDRGEVSEALDAGEAYAKHLVDAGIIVSAALSVKSSVRLVGTHRSQLIQQEELAWT